MVCHGKDLQLQNFFSLKASTIDRVAFRDSEFTPCLTIQVSNYVLWCWIENRTLCCTSHSLKGPNPRISNLNLYGFIILKITYLKCKKENPVCLYVYHAVAIQTSNKCAAIQSEYCLAQWDLFEQQLYETSGACVEWMDGDCMISSR